MSKFKFNNNGRRKTALHSYMLAFNQDSFSGSVFSLVEDFQKNFQILFPLALQNCSGQLNFFLEEGQDYLFCPMLQPFNAWQSLNLIIVEVVRHYFRNLLQQHLKAQTIIDHQAFDS